MRVDPKGAKKVKRSVFFALLESAHVKPAHKMLVKSTPNASNNLEILI